MKKVRRKYDAKFKAQVAIEAIKERETLSEFAAKFELLPVMISRWKKEFIDNSAAVFGNPVADDAALEKQKDRYLSVRRFCVRIRCHIRSPHIGGGPVLILRRSGQRKCLLRSG